MNFLPALDKILSRIWTIQGLHAKFYKISVLPVVWASQDVANVIMIIVNDKVDLAIL